MSKQSFETGYVLFNTKNSTYEFITCNSIDSMFTAISKIHCFNDIDETFEVSEIFLDGKKVEYIGWQEGMHFEYRFIETDELAWEGWFDEWEH